MAHPAAKLAVEMDHAIQRPRRRRRWRRRGRGCGGPEIGYERLKVLGEVGEVEVQIRLHRRKTGFSLVETIDRLRSCGAQIAEVCGMRLKFFQRLFVQLPQRARFVFDRLFEGLDATLKIPGIGSDGVCRQLAPLVQRQSEPVDDRIEPGQPLFEIRLFRMHRDLMRMIHKSNRVVSNFVVDNASKRTTMNFDRRYQFPLRGATVTRTGTAAAVLAFFVSWLIVCSASISSAGQDALAHAKDLYTSAAYDEALAALTGYQPPPDHAIEADEYRAFCLLALGKNADASKIIEQIVTADPSFLPAENQASPRVQEAFRDVRKRVLPAIVRSAYADAKTAFDRKDFETAGRQFDRVLTLLKDPAAAGSSDLADLRTLSNGFLDLMKTAAAAAPPPPAASAPDVPPAPRIYGVDDGDVSPPVVVSEVLPPWRPSRQETQTHEVTMVLVIDEKGNVDSFRLEGNLYASYNTQLRDAVRHWKYRPAMKDGTPVKFRKVVRIRLSPGDGSQSATARR